MDDCDVLIVGGGPAGSSCAWKLRDSGLSTVILDKKTFPRDKVCGGWITPQVVDALQIDLPEYARTRVLQPIRGFRTSRMGAHEVQTDYDQPISYGIRRCEFDYFLLRRSAAHVHDGKALTSLEKSNDRWIVNGEFRARLVVGAGGHFCPLAKLRGANARKEAAIAAQELEFQMTEEQQKHCSVDCEIPELYFCPDMKGYGWCVRKKNFLNVGLGRMDPHGLPNHVAGLLDFLQSSGKVAFELPGKMLGHSYLLYGYGERNVAADGVLLVGDAAGLAYMQSGEGIRPAVESGLLAARAILEEGVGHIAKICDRYRTSLTARFARSKPEWVSSVGCHIPRWLLTGASQLLLRSQWFSRRVLLEQWFLHRNEPALNY
jgi:menaquinone-9 beta-reductase